MALAQDFEAHLAGGVTTLARCWALTRRDGRVLGFTDHDRDVVFGGITFRADTGLSARALQQTTGLSIDNSEALGALSDAAVTEADIRAGRYDGAEVRAWLVNWAAPEQRHLMFRGQLGEITRGGGAFRAELVGLSEALNRAQGRVYQVPCAAVLGDAGCKVDLADPAFSAAGVVLAGEAQRRLRIAGFEAFADGWFASGRLVVLSGAAKGLVATIKADRLADGLRNIELWQGLRAEIATGDKVRLEAGCDKRPETCKDKFANFLNYRGFPDIPGEDQAINIRVRDGAATSLGRGK
ncbi:DUF2163 domain-containing protein [Sinisalibacter lacisalsi]|uniref:Bacteriophage phiJL001 Gp84 C-terminal domain-containing protein n=1 Tax=Sinisalibacter lacisalsi TaxID=1526570 RepID=A0ABQ1QQC2_9RHOB|nr:DUF2163 domain-containing protein [Sinisalibacter lacisalsi]GGD40658.1 hypothetical protein GCM10011358_25740 [Sinisalibacter lacisalsi]